MFVTKTIIFSDWRSSKTTSSFTRTNNNDDDDEFFGGFGGGSGAKSSNSNWEKEFEVLKLSGPDRGASNNISPMTTNSSSNWSNSFDEPKREER